MRVRFISTSLLVSACGTIEIGSYGPAPGGDREAGASGVAIDSGPGVAGASPSAGSAGSGFDGLAGAAGHRAGSNGSAAGTGGVEGGLESVDIGDTGAIGSTTVEGESYRIEGSGADVAGTDDGFRFLYRSLDGDGQIVARIQEVTQLNSWTKIGVMIRSDLTANATNAFMLLHPAQGSAFQYRAQDGAATVSTWQDKPVNFTPEYNVRYLRPPKWLKLTREGDVVTAYSSDDGKCWWRRWTEQVAFDGGEAFFGVALTAGAHGDLASAVVTNVDVESAIEPHNARCERAQVDGDLPLAPAEHWIVAPQRFGGATWDLTTTNPNGSLPISKCNPDAQDYAPYEIAPRRDGPDHPNCPDRGFSPAWTQLGFEPDQSWEFERPTGIGLASALGGETPATFLDSRGVWLRKEFTLTSHTQKATLMLWGRWGDGITVYFNGVLATSNGAGTSEYKYLGLSRAARDALVVGATNVIAVRLEWDRHYWNGNEVAEGDAWDRFFDLGLTTSDRLATVPLSRSLEPNFALTAYVDSLKEFVQEQGISGATFALSKNGTVVASAGFGWRDKNLTVPMPADARLRLAANEQVITNAAIVKLIEDGVVEPSTAVFPRLGLEPVPGRSRGADVDLITVEQLRAHTSGIGTILQDQRVLDEMAFAFGISPDQWTSEHRARWLYSLDATDVGGAGRYSEDGYFLLRYLIEKLVAPRTLEQYLTDDLGLTGVAVSQERLAGRDSNEGYVTREPTWDRWLALESSLALSAPATSYAKFFHDFALGYSLESDARYVPGGGGVLIAGMPGTWSMAFVEPERDIGMVMLTNSHGTFDELITLLHRLTYEGSPCMFGPGDPRDHLDGFQFIDNIQHPEHYLNIEYGTLAASPALAGFWSAQWWLESVEGSYYRLRNRWTDEYLHTDSGLVEIGAIDPSSWSAQWQLVYVGGVYQLRNRSENTYLAIEDGALTASSDGAANSALWRFCQ